MNKKIKIIDLLNKIANGEEVPTKIKSEDKELHFQNNETSIDYLYRTHKNGNGWLVVQDISLNDEVEILEDNTEDVDEGMDYRTSEDDLYNDNFDDMFRKINELVREVNELKEGINK